MYVCIIKTASEHTDRGDSIQTVIRSVMKTASKHTDRRDRIQTVIQTVIKTASKHTDVETVVKGFFRRDPFSTVATSVCLDAVFITVCMTVCIRSLRSVYSHAVFIATGGATLLGRVKTSVCLDAML